MACTRSWEPDVRAYDRLVDVSRTAPDWASGIIRSEEVRDLLQPEAMLTVCREIGYTTWRDRVLPPVTTMQLFLLQILHGNPAAAICPIYQACASRQRRTVKPVLDSRSAFLTSSWSASAVLCNDPPWTTGGGMGIAPFSS